MTWPNEREQLRKEERVPQGLAEGGVGHGENFQGSRGSHAGGTVDR